MENDADGDITAPADERPASSSAADTAVRSTTLAAIKNKSAASARHELFDSSVECRGDIPAGLA